MTVTVGVPVQFHCQSVVAQSTDLRDSCAPLAYTLLSKEHMSDSEGAQYACCWRWAIDRSSGRFGD